MRKTQSEKKEPFAELSRYDITAGILAGGKSSRMGENKSFLPWRGTTILRHELAQLKFFSQILISVAERQEYLELEEQGIVLVEDSRKAYGPLEGIYQLLKHAKHEWVFVLATDMPLVERNLIEQMLTLDRQGVQAVVLQEGERIQPLCGLYHVSILPVLEELFQEEVHSMYQLLNHISVRYIPLEELQLTERILTNVNTPEEYGKLLEKEAAKDGKETGIEENRKEKRGEERCVLQ